MTREEILLSVIEKCTFVNGKWKVAVSLNDKFYGFRLEGTELDTKTELLDKIYKQLLNVEIQADVVVPTIIEKEDIKGSTPEEIKR